jgi:hypothetical protein
MERPPASTGSTPASTMDAAVSGEPPGRGYRRRLIGTTLDCALQCKRRLPGQPEEIGVSDDAEDPATTIGHRHVVKPSLEHGHEDLAGHRVRWPGPRREAHHFLHPRVRRPPQARIRERRSRSVRIPNPPCDGTRREEIRSWAILVAASADRAFRGERDRRASDQRTHSDLHRIRLHGRGTGSTGQPAEGCTDQCEPGYG